MLQTLNTAGASAGTKYRSSEFSMPIAAAASATSIRNGIITRVSTTVSSIFPGTAAKSPASSITNGWANTMPATTMTRSTTSSALTTLLPSRHAARLPSRVRLAREGRHERRAHRALREQVADEVRDAERDVEGVHGVAGAEQVGHHLLAREAEDAARHRRRADETGRSREPRDS